MHKVIVDSLTFGRRTYAKDSVVTEKEIPARLIAQLEKAKKVEKVEGKTEKKK